MFRIPLTVLAFLPLLVVVAPAARQAMPPVAAPVNGGSAAVAKMASVASPPAAAVSPSPVSPSPIAPLPASPDQAQLGVGTTTLGLTLAVAPSTKPGTLIQPYHNSPLANQQGDQARALQVDDSQTDNGGGGGDGGGNKTTGGDSLQSLSSVSLPLSITAIIGLSVGSVACAALLGIILYAFVRCCCAGKKPKRGNHAVLHSSEELNEAHAEGAQGAEPSASPAMEEANAVTSSQPIVPLEASDNLALPSKSLNDLDAQAASSQPPAPDAELITVSKQGELVPAASK